jgi:hypothetical protein
MMFRLGNYDLISLMDKSLTERISHKGLTVMKMGNRIQKPLNKSGDDVKIDWGYLYLACSASNAKCFANEIWGDAHINITVTLCHKLMTLITEICTDQIISVVYCTDSSDGIQT